MEKKRCLKENKKGRHAELDSASHLVSVLESGEIPYQVRNDNIFYCGGFTLIELLVVVLIIGILAAVALPQYEKAVEKSRAVQALSLFRPISQAVASYYLANGTGPTGFDELAVDLSSWTGHEQWSTDPHVKDTRSNGDWSLQLYEGGSIQVYLGRISGKYKGAGFVNSVLDADRNYVAEKIACGERVSGGVLFEESADSYCKKIMGGTFQSGTGTGSSSTARWYTMP